MSSLFGRFFNAQSSYATASDNDGSGVDLVDGDAHQHFYLPNLRGSTTAKGHLHQGSQSTRSGVVEETSSSSDDEDKDDDGASACDSASESDDPSTETTSTRTLRFDVIEMEKQETESFEYLSSVLNWRAEPHVGKHQLGPSVQFGPYTLTELIDAVKSAADASGFATYAFRGARKSETSCSIKFGCDHGRLRYGKEKEEIRTKQRDFVKDMQEVVHDQPGKRRRPRKSGGYKRSQTQRQRVKSKNCPFTICLKSCGEKWGPDMRCMWTLNGDARSASCYDHRNHCKNPFRCRMSDEIKSNIIENGERMLVSDLVSHIFKKFSVEISSDQVKYILRKHAIKNLSSAGAQRFRAGGAVDAVRYLLGTEASDVRLLLINCETGCWFTGVPDKRCENITLTPYDLSSMRLSKTDPTREIMINGSKYMIWVAAWNYRGESELFSAYPHVVQMDCMHGVTSSTDGFNAVGIDGNGHNVQILRAYVSNQDSNVFGWLFNVAFPDLVPMYKKIRVFFLDGCKAMNAALRQACCIGQAFENAKIFRCIFHLIIKAFEDKFGCDKDGWQSYVKKLVHQLRRCEDDDEFTACSEFVMRTIAALPGLGTARSSLRGRVLAFVQRRIDCSKLWVLMHQLHLPTRACTSTSRVEGTHGRDRVDDRITARNSWSTTAKKNTERSNRRQRARIAWARRQVGSQLLRSPMNPDESVFTKGDVDGMDAVMLPWAVECVEEQAALGQKMRVIYTKKGQTKETKSHDTSRNPPDAGEFKVWYDDGDGSNDDGDAMELKDDDLSDYSDSSESGSSSSTDGESSECSPDYSPEKKSQDSSSEDLDEDKEDVFNPEEFLDQCIAAPLEGGTKFYWRKVRTVLVAPLYDDAQRNTGKYQLLCNCGFPTRIGVVCRHIFAVLFHMLCNLLRTDSEGSGDDEPPGPRSIDWSTISLQQLCNMDIVSKVKYHAALHGRGNLFKLSTNPFRPAIPFKVAQDFFRQYDPMPRSEQNIIPHNGLPRDESDVDFTNSDAPPKTPASREQLTGVNRREIQPTEFGVSSLLMDTWKFTNRFNVTDKNTARKLIRQRIMELQNEIKGMETQTVRSEELHRRFSPRDMFNGNAQRRRN